MTPDSALLRQYAEQGDEAAFAELVRRHVNLVYASALRLLNGDAALAQDVTQKAFTDLARKAPELGQYATVAGWLHTSVRYAALGAIRAEQRRRSHEQEASTMINQPTTHDASDWSQLRPLIDRAIGQLLAPERDVVLLRFFEEKSHREIGEALGVNENAARMRVERAVEKLRVFFARHGVKTTAALLTSTLSAQTITPAPAAFAATVAGKSLAGAMGAKTMGLFASKTKAILAGTALLAAAASTVVIVQSEQNTPPPPPKKAVTTTPPVATKISALPNPTMNTSQILSTGTLAAALLATTPALAQTAASADKTAQNTQQTSPAPANPQTTDTPPATPNSAPQATAQIGIATWRSGESPVLVDTSGVLNGKTITAIASSGGNTPHWLALCSDGNVAAWGDNSKGQLGNGKIGSYSSGTTPVLVTMPSVLHGVTFTSVAAYGNYSMALTSDGKAYVWGTDDTGDGKTPAPKVLKIQDGSTSFASDSPRPAPSIAGKNTVAIAAGSDPLFLYSDGSVYTWGAFWKRAFSPAMEKLGSSLWPYGALEHKTVTAIAGGRYHLLSLCSDGTLVFWGFLGDDLPNILLSQPNPNSRPLRTNQNINLVPAKFWHRVVDCVPPPGVDMDYAPSRNFEKVIVPPGEIDPEDSYLYYRLWVSRPLALNDMGVLTGKTITAISAGGGNNCLSALCSDGTLVIWRAVRLPDVPSNSLFHPVSSDVLHLQTQTGRTPCVMAVTVETAEGKLKGKKVTAMGSSVNGLAVACSDGTVAEWGSSGKLTIVDTSGELQGKKILAVAPGIALFSDQGNGASSRTNDNSANSGTPASPAYPTSPDRPDRPDSEPNPLGPGGVAGAFKSFGH